MSNLTLTLPDGNSLQVEEGQSYGEAVRQIGEGLFRNALAVTVDGVHHSLAEKISAGGEMLVITRGAEEGLDTLRHSTAHLNKKCLI